MKLLVHGSKRNAKMRAHTATHLLHFALDKLLGSTKQAGSLVDNDYLRFDFEAKNPLEENELLLIESQINDRIRCGSVVSITQTSLEEAKKMGAKAFFEDTYGEEVRVVSIECTSDNSLDLASKELCGGIHVQDISHIGAFKIVQQTAVASGIRRIEAVTGTSVTEQAQKSDRRLADISSRLDCQPKQLENKLEKILKEYGHLQSDHALLQGKLICTHLDEFHNECDLPSAGSARGKGCIINVSGSSLEDHTFKEVIHHAKARWSDRNWIIYSDEGNFAIYTGTGDLSAKQFARDQGLKGGGSDQFVQGKDEKIKEIV